MQDILNVKQENTVLVYAVMLFLVNLSMPGFRKIEAAGVSIIRVRSFHIGITENEKIGY